MTTHREPAGQGRHVCEPLLVSGRGLLAPGSSHSCQSSGRTLPGGLPAALRLVVESRIEKLQPETLFESILIYECSRKSERTSGIFSVPLGQYERGYLSASVATACASALVLSL